MEDSWAAAVSVFIEWVDHGASQFPLQLNQPLRCTQHIFKNDFILYISSIKLMAYYVPNPTD